ncbi:hypothetical protein TEA_016827 [Camellia sinensis var. sinensis]|uniref:Peptidase S26 domain-containing protein n=1 Tax=Camellia sinensis var. sinensis TaxID=542762 RepID=A0A4S4EC24_CAMSN|nr:hypothetical protein TEA_016827 [Camellia sinensis var. sinensis]
MVSLSNWFRYLANKLEYSACLSLKRFEGGQITEREVVDIVWKNLFQGKLTYLHWNKGEEMVPTIAAQGGTLLVRKIPEAEPTGLPINLPYLGEALDVLFGGGCVGLFVYMFSAFTVSLLYGFDRSVFVGDMVVLKDPQKTDNYLVRRLAAIEGYEMVSTNEKDVPFVLEKDQCWVLSDNENLKPKEANDSRRFGPLPMTDIVGRVIYSLRTAVDHGPVKNSHLSMRRDSSVLAVELDVDEMTKNHKA